MLGTACDTARFGGGTGGDDDELDAAAITPPRDGGDADGGTVDAWLPQPLTATRFAIFYQATGDVVDLYANPNAALPMSSDHAYIFAVSHLTAEDPADRGFADRIHQARSDFKYAPCFDLNNHQNWLQASDEDLARMAHDFRDKALADHADFFCFNEAPTNTGSSEEARVRMMKILAALDEPGANGAVLRGIFFMTEAATNPANWNAPAVPFWQRVNQTCDAVVAEHYHSQSFVCSTSTTALASHFFALRNTLDASGDPDKGEIANSKFVVLHSARYGAGSSGWGGADSAQVTLTAFQHNLSRVAMVTRKTSGGYNRIAYAPISSSITSTSVHPRIQALLRWHYGDDEPAASETSCIDGVAGNCECQ